MSNRLGHRAVTLLSRRVASSSSSSSSLPYCVSTNLYCVSSTHLPVPVFSYSSSSALRRCFSTNSNHQEKEEVQSSSTTTSSESTSSTGSENDKSTPPTDPRIAELEQKLLESEKLVAKWKNDALRYYADGENIRKRGAKEAEDARTYAVTSFAKSLLEVADTLEISLKNVEPHIKEASGPFKALIEGLQMTQHILQKSYERNKVTRMNSLGEKFDPNYHEGLFQVDDPKLPPNTIHTVMREGYKIGDRVLRAAQVGTVKSRPVAATAQQTSTTTTANENETKQA